MRHSIPVEQLEPRDAAMAAPIEACVHCGFCLSTCPTYVTMGEEMDSPRGRILLIKEVLEGGLELEAVLPYVDNCLACEACVTACPSGVEYGDLIVSFRDYAERGRRRPIADRLRRGLALRTLSQAYRLRLAARFGGLARATRRALPSSLAVMVGLLPRRLPPRRGLPERVEAEGARRARVALLVGCAQDALDPDITSAAIRVLARNGVEVLIPPSQGCCGSLAMHTGGGDQARRLARVNLEAFDLDVDAVLTTAAGCGSGMRAYGGVFRGEADEERAESLARKTLDVSEFLAELGLREPPPPLAPGLTIAYHDACHLAHAQGVRSAPRALLEAVDGLTLAEPPEWELCCGSAGIYNVERPDVAAELGERKARNLAGTGAEMIAAGNIGCMNQLRISLAEIDRELPILHTVQVLDRAYSRTLEGRLQPQ